MTAEKISMSEKVQKIDDVDRTTIMEVESVSTPLRDKIRKLLFVALRPRRLDEEREPAIVAVDIECQCFESLSPSEYVKQIRSIRFNLADSKNPNFRAKVLLGYFTSKSFDKLTAEDMASDAKNHEREKAKKRTIEECQSDWALRNGAINVSGMFTCGKCKSTRTTYFQMQTRSSDEPMTTFVTCLGCSNRWKF